MKKIFVIAHPKAKQEKLLQLSENTLEIWTRALPIEGEANEALCEILAEHYGIAKSMVHLKSGQNSRKKLFEIG